ncbi:MAG: hypothetical protein JSV44_04505, partial [Candidatus Zixiibacteriota bacterium]
MKAIIFRLLCLAAFGGSACGQDFREKIDSLKEYEMDNSRRIEIKDFTLAIPYGEIKLVRGNLYLTGYRGDRPTAAFFLGEGEFVYRPRDDIEAQQIRRFYRSDSIRVDFEKIYFAFPEKSRLLESLYNRGTVKKPPYRVRILFNHIREVPDSKFKYNLALNLHKADEEGCDNLVWIDVLKDRYQHTIYYYDPHAPEQVSVYKYTSNFRQPQVVSSVSDGAIELTRGHAEQYDLFRYDIDVDVSTTGKSGIDCMMYCEILADSVKIARFNFPREFMVDSVGGDVPDTAAFIKDKDRPGLAVALSRHFMKGDTVKLSVHYRSNLFRQYMERGVVQENLIGWYPYSGFRQLSEYTVRYRIDKGLGFLAVGQAVSDSSLDGKRLLEYRSPRPIAYVSFNYGVFDTTTIADEEVPVTIYSLPGYKSPVFGKGGLEKVTDDLTAAA